MKRLCQEYDEAAKAYLKLVARSAMSPTEEVLDQRQAALWKLREAEAAIRKYALEAPVPAGGTPEWCTSQLAYFNTWWILRGGWTLEVGLA